MLEQAAAFAEFDSAGDIEAPRNRRILVVDDNPAIHEDFQKIFRSSLAAASELSVTEAAFFGEAPSPDSEAAVDVEMVSAFQGEEALQRVQAALAANEPFAMAFLDVRMPPGWDGIETAARIWQSDPHLQIVLCTAYSDYSWDSMRAQLGRTDRLVILKKPFDTVEALQLADSLIEKWRASRQAALKMDTLELAVRHRTRELEQVNQALQTEIHGRKLLENQLVQAQKLESIGQLAAGIAHEINTPIQYIGDSVDFLRSAVSSIDQVVGEYRQVLESLPELDSSGRLRARLKSAEEAAELEFLHAEIPKAFERTQDGIAHVAKIVRAMKEFSFPDVREQSYSDVNRALETTLVVARNEYKHVARIETDLGEIPQVRCNISELNQVFLNLIVNAAHAIQESGKCAAAGVISVRTAAAAGQVEIQIGDNGCGIAPENHNKVFDPFFTTKPVGRGTGQGLSIAYATVVKKHGGSLSFESELGRGTRFLVRVPQEGYSPEQTSGAGNG
jgi:two-component system, NtrC family, sensor kinase